MVEILLRRKELWAAVLQQKFCTKLETLSVQRDHTGVGGHNEKHFVYLQYRIVVNGGG